MSVDVQVLKAMLEQAVPFIRRIGLEIKSLGDHKVRVELPFRDENANHVGTAHAGVIFTVGETAGAALAASCFDMGKLMIVVRGAKVSYRKPIRGLLTCTGEIDPAAARAASEKVEREGKVNFPVQLKMTNEKGEPAVELEFEYHLRKTG